jgi:chemotaxis protein CheD
MQETIDVNTGEMMVKRGSFTLRAMAIGSCIAIAAYDPKTQNAGMAHVMLPGCAPKKCTEKNRYASDSIEKLLTWMFESGSVLEDIEVCLVGAGNVLEKEDDTICESNIESVSSILKERKIPVRASALGGNKRRSVFLDGITGSVFFTEGNEKEKLLWNIGI